MRPLLQSLTLWAAALLVCLAISVAPIRVAEDNDPGIPELPTFEELMAAEQISYAQWKDHQATIYMIILDGPTVWGQSLVDWCNYIVQTVDYIVGTHPDNPANQ